LHLPLQTAFPAAFDQPFPVTEVDLIAACGRGEHRAQRQLYDQLAGLMLTVCRRYLKRREDAEEALLMGFAKMFRALPTYRFEGSFEGWVRRIMVNEALMLLRQRESMTVSMEDFAQPENLATTPATADTQLQADDLLALLAELPTGYRTVFNLYALEGFGHQEIAGMLGISEGTSKSQLSKARALLQRRISAPPAPRSERVFLNF
jgi:RNA polymerase sigma-70 factor (ECF subfamily)